VNRVTTMPQTAVQAAPATTPANLTEDTRVRELRWAQAGGLPCRLSVQAAVQGFTLKDLLDLRPQSIIRSQLATSANPPLRVNGEVAAWCDFEVLGSRLSLQKRLDATWQQWREHLSCNDPACADSGRIWNRVSHRAGSLRVHGVRYCFPGCFERQLQWRLTHFLSGPPAKPGRAHRMPLGLLMLSRGDIDNTQLRAALAAQRDSGRGRIGEWMQQMGFSEESQVTAALGAQWACPVLSGIPASLSDCELPLPLLRHFRMAAVSYIAATRVMHVAFAEGIDYGVLLAIEQALECRAEPCVTGQNALASLLAQLEQKPRRSDQVFPQARTPDEMTRITSSYAAMLSATDVRLTRCAEFIWVRVEAAKDSANLLFPAVEMPFAP